MEYAILFNILIGLVVLVAVWYFVGSAATESFIGIGPEPPGKVVVTPVPKAEAMQQIQKNLDEEWQLIKDLEPYYEKLVTIAAGSKVTDPAAPDAKAVAEAKKPSVREDIEKETEGTCVPLYDIGRALTAIKNSQLSPEAKLVISYKVLPSNVESYRTTIVFLNKKAIELYRYFTELGGKGSPTAAVQGSSATSMNIKLEGFVSAGNNLAINSASVQAKGPINKLITAYLKQEEPVAAPITDKTIQELYGISNTRMRLAKEYDLRGPVFLDTKNNFDRLNTLIEQVQNPPDTVYAGITEGKSSEAALQGFQDFGEQEDKYAFLKY